MRPGCSLRRHELLMRLLVDRTLSITPERTVTTSMIGTFPYGQPARAIGSAKRKAGARVSWPCPP